MTVRNWASWSSSVREPIQKALPEAGSTISPGVSTAAGCTTPHNSLDGPGLPELGPLLLYQRSARVSAASRTA
jgi:hypothetical protein